MDNASRAFRESDRQPNRRTAITRVPITKCNPTNSEERSEERKGLSSKLTKVQRSSIASQRRRLAPGSSRSHERSEERRSEWTSGRDGERGKLVEKKGKRLARSQRG
ncbi:hypothetical protein KM043_007356 [Ampulex compressa]|nr:hypothetical protein KM043_007356 [Ampulex compressa]